MCRLSSPKEMLLFLILSQVLAYKFLFWLLETCSQQDHVCAQNSQWVSRNEICLKKAPREKGPFYCLFLIFLQSWSWNLSCDFLIPTGIILPWSISFLPAPHLGVFWLTELLHIFLLFPLGSMNVDTLGHNLGFLFVLSNSWLWAVVCGLHLHIRSRPGLAMPALSEPAAGNCWAPRLCSAGVIL